MSVKVGINGLGRIGRFVLRAGFKNVDAVIMFVNGTTDPMALAHFLKYNGASRKELLADVVLKSTGKITDSAGIDKILRADANKVISAPSKGPGVTLVLGVNQNAYIKSKHYFISMVSYKTNCLAFIVKDVPETTWN